MPNQITESIIIQGKPGNLYKLWADLENFPKFIKPLKSVKKTGYRSSHWVLQGPQGNAIEWDVETTRLERNRRIAWSSKGGNGDLKISGQVTFTGLPHDETELTVTLQYVPPAGQDARVVAELLSDPENSLLRYLRNVKAYAEGMPDRIYT